MLKPDTFVAGREGGGGGKSQRVNMLLDFKQSLNSKFLPNSWRSERLLLAKVPLFVLLADPGIVWGNAFLPI